MFYKYIENGTIVYVGGSNIIPENDIEITPDEKAKLSELINSKPADTLEYCYRLSAETETYVPCERTHDETVYWYVQAVSSGAMTIEDVPEGYIAEVEGRLPQPEEQKYTLDEAAEVLAQEVSQNGYDA